MSVSRAPVLLGALAAGSIMGTWGCSGGRERQPEASGAVAWVEEWSPAVFERAAREKRLVLLDLGAVWCHWCHVMDRMTYGDPAVAALLQAHFIALRIDQDSRPDLSNRYEDYGWPATIIFNERGEELVKMRGYIPPERMQSLLHAVVADPTPGPSVVAEPEPTLAGTEALPPAVRDELLRRFRAGYDAEHGGWGRIHKYLDADSVEYALVLAVGGDAEAEAVARKTLTAELNLLDPVWGGVYQYSDGGTWENPHFEKIMPRQAGSLRAYALAYALWGEERHLEAARAIARYLAGFLTSPDGAFYVSQDADLVRGEHSGEYFALGDAARRARGVPAVDKHLYARETGLAASALAALYAASGDEQALARALRAARWVVENRALPGGGFRHDEADAAGPYLADTLAMGRAFLDLHAVTGHRAWLERARAAAAFIGASFAPAEEAGKNPGLASAKATSGAAGPFLPKPQVDENVAAARFLNLLHHYTGSESHRRLAERALRYLAAPEVAASSTVLTARILLVDLELASEPVHITVTGPKDDPRARELHLAALRYPAAYKRVEWWDRREGPLPRQDVEYPVLEAPAAFACARGACSIPIRDPTDLAIMVARLTGAVGYRPTGIQLPR